MAAPKSGAEGSTGGEMGKTRVMEADAGRLIGKNLQEGSWRVYLAGLRVTPAFCGAYLTGS